MQETMSEIWVAILDKIFDEKSSMKMRKAVKRAVEYALSNNSFTSSKKSALKKSLLEALNRCVVVTRSEPTSVDHVVLLACTSIQKNPLHSIFTTPLSISNMHPPSIAVVRFLGKLRATKNACSEHRPHRQNLKRQRA